MFSLFDKVKMLLLLLLLLLRLIIHDRKQLNS